ncbi:MAG: response regulator transcription factor [Lentimicrobiaceae bacterium]|nr:response regulator transcription factor [Lentimicrobiaceae bacterium]
MLTKRNLTILLAEDDQNLGNILSNYLIAKGFDVQLCTNGQEAIDMFLKTPFNLCILDIMMPKKDGITVAQEIRQFDKKVPILFLTAKSMEEDKLRGFQSGADDYVTKPFSMEELKARMEAILRRSEPDMGKEEGVYEIGKYIFDYNHQTITFEGETQKLTSKESELLNLFCQFKNETLERSFALNRIWQNDSYFNARSMDVYITKLRKILSKDPNVEIINVHGIGFKLTIKE